MIRKMIILSLLLAMPLCAEDLPDAPSVAATVEHKTPSTWHELRVPLAAMWGANTADIALTCVALGNGGHENWLPSQSCNGTAAIMLGYRAAATGAAWILVRKGHPRIAKALLWGMTADTAIAVSLSAAHWNDPVKVKP